jgi:lipoprotein-releasing system permease protein
MISLHYLTTALRYRPSRTLASVLSIAIGIALFLSLQAYADGYRHAARAPLTEMGADLTASRQGDVPDKFAGIVFPHSVAPIHQNDVAEIRRLPSVQAIAQVIFFWDFEPYGFVAGLGFNPSDTFGPGRLGAAITAGRFLQSDERGATIVDATYAQQNRITLGGTVMLGGRPFAVVGLADTSRTGQLANANVYISLTDARTLMNEAPQVRSLFPIRPDDANLLFIRTDQTQTEQVSARVKQILGAKAIVSSPQSFAAQLGALFALIDRFGWLVGGIAFLFAVALLLRVLAASVWERRRDLAIMRAVGWRRQDVMVQLWSEAVALALAGALIGVVLAAAAIGVMRLSTVTIPVPWELAPSPHFLPGGARAVAVTILFPAHLTPGLLVWAVVLAAAGASLVGLWLPGRIAQIRPAEVLRSE